MEYSAFLMFITDILVAALTVIALSAILDNIFDNFLSLFKNTLFLNFRAKFFNHTTVFMAADPGIAVIAVSVKITDIVCADSGGLDPDQNLIFRNRRSVNFFYRKVLWLI